MHVMNKRNFRSCYTDALNISHWPAENWAGFPQKQKQQLPEGEKT